MNTPKPPEPLNPCPFCGRLPTIITKIEPPKKESGKWYHVIKMEPCCSVFGSGRTELFFDDEKCQETYDGMCKWFYHDWNTRTRQPSEDEK